MYISFDCDDGEVEIWEHGIYVNMFDNSFSRHVSFCDMAPFETDASKELCAKLDSLFKHLLENIVVWLKQQEVYRYSPEGSADSMDPDWPPFPPEAFPPLLSCALLSVLGPHSDIDWRVADKLIYSRN